MSLANIIMQPPTGYLITDSGWFERDGRLAYLMPKVLHFPNMRMAISCRGQHDMLAGILRELRSFERQRGSTNGGEVVAAFADLYFAATIAQGVPSSGIENACDMQMVWYDPARKRATGHLICNITDHMPGLPPFTLQRVSCSLSSKIDPDAPLGRPQDVTDPGQFDIRKDGRTLVDAQRREGWTVPGRPFGYYVAGDVHLTTIDEAGVRCETLISWPDEIGKKIAVDA